MDDTERAVVEMLSRGVGKGECAKRLGLSRPKVQRIARKHNVRQAYSEPLQVANEALAALGLVDRTFRRDGEQAECVIRVPRFISSEEEALKASNVDLSVWNVVSQEIRHYAMPTADGPIQASYVKLKLARKRVTDDPAALAETLTRILEETIPARPKPAAVWVPVHKRGLLACDIITDLHFGGYAWRKATGFEDWDINTARSLAYASFANLGDRMPGDVTESLVAFLGDLCHYDTPSGTTTGGTRLDIDSRVDLMLETALTFMVDAIAQRAETRPTTVVLVPGNHDAILSKALWQAVKLHFRTHRHVSLVEGYTKRQYVLWGKNLLGFAHGDGNRQRLAQNMPFEAREHWSRAVCREVHSGHLHHEATKQTLHHLQPTVTEGGVAVRTHVALTPTDQYHADENWVGASRGMTQWHYTATGGCVGHLVALPHVVSQEAA